MSLSIYVMPINKIMSMYMYINKVTKSSNRMSMFSTTEIYALLCQLSHLQAQDITSMLFGAIYWVYIYREREGYPDTWPTPIWPTDTWPTDIWPTDIWPTDI